MNIHDYLRMNRPGGTLGRMDSEDPELASKAANNASEKVERGRATNRHAQTLHLKAARLHNEAGNKAKADVHMERAKSHKEQAQAKGEWAPDQASSKANALSNAAKSPREHAAAEAAHLEAARLNNNAAGNASLGKGERSRMSQRAEYSKSKAAEHAASAGMVHPLGSAGYHVEKAEKAKEVGKDTDAEHHMGKAHDEALRLSTDAHVATMAANMGGKNEKLHKVAGEKNLAAAKAHSVIAASSGSGNTALKTMSFRAGHAAQASEHKEKAAEHASAAGSSWDEGSHPRNENGEFD